MRHTSIVFNRLMYVGFTVLGISKTIKYSFHYGYAARKCGLRLRLLKTDTDSLMCSVETSDLYHDTHEGLQLFDTSDYPCDILATAI